MDKNLSLDDVCKLIHDNFEIEVFCCKLSVSTNAFYHYGEKGLKPDILLAVNSFEYSGEAVVEHNGIRYAITRTYERSDDLIELTGTKKAGIQNSGKGNKNR